MIEYRSFQNSDPPKIVSLWHECRLGRGAAAGITTDAFETILFAVPYFDRHGLIVAREGSRIVGFAHSGFGPTSDGGKLDCQRGVICAVLVHPDFRRQGIGRELVSRAERFLHDSGSSVIQAGAAPPCDPFYVGLYGGSEPAGFLESDPSAAPFFEAVGYHPFERHAVFQRDITQPRDAVNFRLSQLRRKLELAVSPQAAKVSWWWLARYARLDSLRFTLVPKGGGQPLAGITAVGLDFYFARWNERAVGLVDLWVSEKDRRHGYGQMLVLDVCKKLRQELVTCIETHAAEKNTAATQLFASTGFERIDTGIVFQRAAE